MSSKDWSLTQGALVLAWRYLLLAESSLIVSWTLARVSSVRLGFARRVVLAVVQLTLSWLGTVFARELFRALAVVVVDLRVALGSVLARFVLLAKIDHLTAVLAAVAFHAADAHVVVDIVRVVRVFDAGSGDTRQIEIANVNWRFATGSSESAITVAN